MDRLGPWDPARRVAVAVSGGPDSLALAILARHWGDPIGLIVDHGLRAEAADEAEAARAALLSLGIPASVIRLHGLNSGPGLAARARDARYGALTAACRGAGLVDLLLGHHAGDQAETVLMRQRRHSGPSGLAGMAALVETDDLRLLRPLLFADPADLRAMVLEAGLVAAEDPSNTDERSTRARLRREIGTDRATLLAAAKAAGRIRAESEAGVAAELAQHASLFPEGYATVHDGQVTAAALAGLLRSISGRRYPVQAGRLAALLRAATTAGVRVQRGGDGWRLTREMEAVAPPVRATPGAVWDGRFHICEASVGGEVAALGTDASRFRALSDLPSSVLQSLPAIRYNGVVSEVPHLGYRLQAAGAGDVVLRAACLPAAGAPFLAH